MLREMTSSAFGRTFKRFAQGAMLGLALAGLAACGGGGSSTPAETTPTPTPTPDPAPTPAPAPTPNPPQMNIMPPNQPTLPPALTPSSPPQASGTDISTIEIAGLGTTRRFAVRNSGETTLSIPASSWYEPKDGSYQRMMVTRTTSVPPGQVVEVPIACMQESKRVPATGLRFFSSPKAVTGAVQGCQRNCLSGAEAGIQNCIWGCESTAASPTGLGCFFSAGGVSTCAEGGEYVPSGECSGPGYEVVQQCPRSGSEYSLITECALPTGDRDKQFTYSPSSTALILGALRMTCEASGGSFHIHQQ